MDRAVCELLKWGEAPCASREHALGLLVQKMRYVVVDLAKALAATKRGGAGRGRCGDPFQRREVAEVELIGREADPGQFIALGEALERLEQIAPRLRRVVDMRFLLGLTVDETAAALELSPASVRKDTQLAKAWLYKELVEERGAVRPNPRRDGNRMP